MKPRPPTIRTKKRYILARCDPPDGESQARDLYYSLLNSFTGLFGDETSAQAGIAVISFESGYAEIRCTRGFEEKVRTALIAITSLSDRPVAIRTIITSGTLLALRKKRTSLLSRPPWETCEIEILGIVYSARRYQGQKVDLVKKGIRGQELLFLTKEDIEELHAATSIPDGI